MEISVCITQSGWKTTVPQEECDSIPEEEYKMREEIQGTNHFAGGTLLKLYFG
jgi:hypothetical protein